MRMAAAEFHEVIAAVGARLAPDGDGEFLRDLAVAEFIDVFHQCTVESSPNWPISANSASVLAASSGSSLFSA
jgi:hypothetical protein